MFLIYQIIISFLTIISPIIIIFRIIKNKEDSKRFIEKFSFPTLKRKKEINLVSWRKCWGNFKCYSIN